MRPRTLDEFVGQEHLLGDGSALRTAIESGRAALDDPLRAAGDRQDDARAAGRPSTPTAAFEELSAVEAGRAEVREVIARAGERRRGGPARRSSSSTRSTASTRPSRTRCCRAVEDGHRHADRRDDREPVLRGQLGADLAHADLRAARARRPRTSQSLLRRALERGECEGVRVGDEVIEFLAARAGGDARAALNALELALRDRRRAGRRGGHAGRTPRTRCSARRCSTTRPATSTTTSSRPGSSRRAAPTPTRRSTTSRRCSRAARTRASSPGG